MTPCPSKETRFQKKMPKNDNDHDDDHDDSDDDDGDGTNSPKMAQ